MKQFIRIVSALLCVLLLTACGSEPVATTASMSTDPTTITTAAPITEPQPEGIRNIIIIIGDGTGDAQLKAGELASGTTFVFRDWQHTHANTDSLHSDGTGGKLTDSAAAGTALATGQLTTNSAVGKDASGTDLKTILDYAQEHGKATGVVSTDTIYGATPAAFSGHAAVRTDTQTILTTQLGSNIDLLCASYDNEVSAMKGTITACGYAYCDFISQIGATKSADKVYWQFDMAGSSATAKLENVVPHALEFLEKDEDGFVLMIEQAHVDKYCHSNEIEGAQLSANSLNNTVQAVLDWAGDRTDTAIIITADHETGGLSVSEEDIYDSRYVSKDGNVLFYQWTTTNHTQTPVSVYWYGFTPDLSEYYLDEEQTLIKNTDVFRMMLALLENPLQYLP